MSTRRDHGQAAVEFAIALPLVAVLVLGILQVVIVARDQLAIELAAREGARAAAVAASPSAAADSAARSATSLSVDVSTAASTERVVVTVRYRSPTDVPLIGSAIGAVTLTATVTMAREPP